MKVKVFTLRWRPEGGDFDDGDLQEFLETRTVLDVSEHFFVHEKSPVLVLVVTYRDCAPSSRRGSPGGPGARAPDPAFSLTPDERRRYEALRGWRNQYARRVGRPPYAVFTNRQAEEMARRVPTTRVQLGEVQGIGTSRLEEFGDEIIALLASVEEALHEAPAGSAP